MFQCATFFKELKPLFWWRTIQNIIRGHAAWFCNGMDSGSPFM